MRTRLSVAHVPRRARRETSFGYGFRSATGLVMHVIVSKPPRIERSLGHPFPNVADETSGIGYSVKKGAVDTAKPVLVAPTRFNDALVFVTIKEGLADQCILKAR